MAAVSAAGVLLAQEASPTFEVVSVKKSLPVVDGPMMIVGGARTGEQWRASNATLRLLLRSGYGVEFPMEGQVVGGPAWMDTDRFEVQAKVPPGTSDADVRAMVRSLLADRFQLRVHTERRELPVYALVLARSDGKLSPQMRPIDCEALRAARAKGDPPPITSDGTPQCSMGTMLGRITEIKSGGVTMAALAGSLSRSSGRPVFDRTGAKAFYAFTLRFASEPGVVSTLGGPPQSVSIEPVDAPSLASAVQEQLGLRLESRREPMDVLVIDGASQPSEN